MCFQWQADLTSSPLVTVLVFIGVRWTVIDRSQKPQWAWRLYVSNRYLPLLVEMGHSTGCLNGRVRGQAESLTSMESRQLQLGVLALLLYAWRAAGCV